MKVEPASSMRVHTSLCLIILVASLGGWGCTAAPPAPTVRPLVAHGTPADQPRGSDPEVQVVLLAQKYAPAGVTNENRILLLQQAMQAHKLVASYTWDCLKKRDSYQARAAITVPDRPPLVFLWNVDPVAKTCVTANQEAETLSRLKFKLVEEGLGNWLH